MASGVIPMVDAHALILSSDVQRYPPSPSAAPLPAADRAEPMTAERLLREMDAHGIGRAVLVQRGAVYGFDNSYVCDAAAAAPERLLAVCAVDARDAGAAGALRVWAREHGARGVRFMEPHRDCDLSWLAGESARAVWREATDLGLIIDVHFFRWNRAAGLQALQGLVREFGDATVVLNNLSNIDALAGAPDYGLDAPLQAFAPLAQVYLKVTTIPLASLASEALPLAPLVDRMVVEFGAARLLWGTDVAVGARSYAQQCQLGIEATQNLPAAARAQVLGGTALSVYWGPSR